MKKGEQPVSSQGKQRQQKISSGEDRRREVAKPQPPAVPSLPTARTGERPCRNEPGRPGNTSVNLREPPYTERYVRWCERTGARRPLLLDLVVVLNEVKDLVRGS